MRYMKILVTAGPTRESIDPVRFISNRSTGKMGYAVAESAVEKGHDVRLVSGPVALKAPDGLELVSVESAEDMYNAVVSSVEWCDVLVMTAAVADWRPRENAPDKLKKSAMKPVIELERTKDILGAIREVKGDRTFIGFNADTKNVLQEGERKLREKGLDMVVSNDVSLKDAGFAVDTNRVTFIFGDGEVRDQPLMTKREVADLIIDWAESA